MKVLAIDTTTQILSIAFFEENHLLANASVLTKKGSSSKLFCIIERVLQDTGLDKKDLDVVGVSVGPGSFTGVRVGVAAVKALAYALDLKVVAVSTLEAMAYLYPVEGKLLFPLLDARRGQFYGAMFRWLEGKCERLSHDSLLNPEDVERIAPSVLFIGESAGRFGFRYIPAHGIANGVALCTLCRAKEGRFTPLGKLKPIYLRPSDAEQKYGITVYKA